MRRSLRLEDNASLVRAAESGFKTQPIFIFDSEILKRFSNKEDRRLTFLVETIFNLDQELKKHSSRLLVFYGNPRKLIPEIAKELKIEKVFAEEDFEPGTRKRDAAVSASLKEFGSELVLTLDHLIQHPKKILKADGKPYCVFTPYSKAWMTNLSKEDYSEKGSGLKINYAQLKLEKALDLSSPTKILEQLGYKYNSAKDFPVDNPKKILSNFIHEKVAAYKTGRDFMFGDNTSKLSPYLRFGLISIRECFREVYGLHNSGAETWLKELIWREFYAMILLYFPETVNLEFNERYRKISWNYDDELFKAWKEGMTGFPVVDAAMRELKETGWMHNRARMIVASFLTKDLLIDWRLGEEHFAQFLMDYEQASNVGGWQWAASTGTDAAPYFRMFNPIIQSKKFDPKGKYIRKFVPELEHLSDSEIHEPWKNPLLAGKYPKPIVDRADARNRVMEAFKKL